MVVALCKNLSNNFVMIKQLIISALLLVAISLNAQVVNLNSMSLSLEESVNYALSNNTNQKIREFDKLSNEERYNQSKRDLLTGLTAAASQSLNNNHADKGEELQQVAILEYTNDSSDTKPYMISPYGLTGNSHCCDFKAWSGENK